MKKGILFTIVIIALLLSTFKYHLGKIPAVNAYIYYNISPHLKKLDLTSTSSPLVARVLIFFGAELNPSPTCKKYTKPSSPLMAQISAYNDCFRYFDVYEKSKNFKCQSDHLKIIEILLDNNADIKGALFESDHISVLELLLKYGADIEEKKHNGITPLFYRTKFMHKDAIFDYSTFKFLVSKGADIHVQDNQKQTLLHVAKNSEVIEFLLKNGLDVNAQDKFGNTPIFYASENQRELKPLMTLVENGANVNIKNNEGATALEYTLKNNYRPNRDNTRGTYLLENGAIINDEIYVNSLFIDKPKKLPSEELQKELLLAYSNINKNGEYDIATTMSKMDLTNFPYDVDRWKTMEYLLNLDFAKKVIATYDKDISKIHNRSQNTPLHYVVRYSTDLTDYFIKRGADVNSLNNQGQTPLFFAESIDIAKKLINHGADIYIKDKEGKSALDYIKNPELLNYLLSKGTNAKQLDNKQRSPLINYIHNNTSSGFRTADHGLKYDKHYATIKVFLDNGADINERIPDVNETMLFYVNDTKLADQLIADGIDIEAKNKMGQTALFKFLRFPVVDMGKELIRKGADTSAVDNGKNTLLHFVFDDQLAQMLINRGVDINSKNSLGDTPLHKLVQKDTTFSMESKYKTFKLFVKKGADVNSQNDKGETPLMIAILAGNKFYIEGLLKAGADATLKDNNGNTVLYYAARGAQNKDYMEYILDKNFDIDINSKNKKSQTILDYSYNQSVKNYLIEKGAKFGGCE